MSSIIGALGTTVCVHAGPLAGIIIGLSQFPMIGVPPVPFAGPPDPPPPVPPVPVAPPAEETAPPLPVVPPAPVVVPLLSGDPPPPVPVPVVLPAPLPAVSTESPAEPLTPSVLSDLLLDEQPTAPSKTKKAQSPSLGDAMIGLPSEAQVSDSGTSGFARAAQLIPM
jgi:hypothetical protein